jgi:hypothetical protein
MNMKTFAQTIKTSFRSFAANGMIMVLALCGVLAVFCFAPQDARDWAKVRKLDALDAEAFEATNPHSSVLVTGVLDGNSTRTPDGLVAYVEQRLDAPDDGGDRYRETWTTIAQVWPPLSVQVDGQRLPVAQVDLIEWDGDLHVAAPSCHRRTQTLAAACLCIPMTLPVYSPTDKRAARLVQARGPA